MDERTAEVNLFVYAIARERRRMRILQAALVVAMGVQFCMVVWGIDRTIRAYFMGGVPLDMPVIFGHKTVALFDLWSPHHFMAGCVTGWVLAFFERDGKNPWARNTPVFCMGLIGLIFAWEYNETILESAVWWSATFGWKDGLEHWSNRFVSDTGLFVVGGILARNVRVVRLPAAVYVVLWMALNVSQPTCMSVQEALCGVYAPWERKPLHVTLRCD